MSQQQYIIVTTIHPDVLRQAIFSEHELTEYELLSPAMVDPPLGFHHVLKEATKITKQFLSEIRPPAGDYFLSPDQRRPGRESQY